MSNPEEKSKIIIDEDWKTQVQAEKEALEQEEPAVTRNESADDEHPGVVSADSPGEIPPPPPASFAQLVTIFATQASVSLQQSANPEDKQRTSHRDYAKHFIDLLGVLDEKTKGNLSEDDAKMLETVLHELRMAFVSLQK